ncbi:MAG TPA: AI-2E family transporter [Candidatus Binataceae bacterium]|nr:AI-2E family transporter [Candidatus Binataceae bacterium]
MDRERIVQVFFFGFLALMAYELYQLLTPFFVPFAWGILLAFMAHPSLIHVQRLVKSRTLASVIISLVVGFLVVMPSVWLSGRLVVEAQALYAEASKWAQGEDIHKINDMLIHIGPLSWLALRMHEHGYELNDQLPKVAMQAAQVTSDYVMKNGTQVARNIAGFVFDFSIALLAFFYMLRDGDYYYQSLRSLTPLHEDDKAAIFETLRATLSSVIRGLMLTALLQGVTIGIGLLVFGVPYWLFLALASAAAGLLPIGGTALIWLPAAIWLLYTAGWGSAIGLVVWCAICLAIIDNFIKPIAMRHGTSLPTLALFLAIMGGIEAYGPLGLFLGPAIISIFAALLRVYRKTYGENRREAA